MNTEELELAKVKWNYISGRTMKITENLLLPVDQLIFDILQECPKLLAHIDEQTKQLIRANHRYADLQQVCDDQDKQIATLKAALVKQYALKCDIQKGNIETANEQLTRELPEIFGEDAQ